MNAYGTEDYIKFHERGTADMNTAEDEREYDIGNLKVAYKKYFCTRIIDGNECNLETTLTTFFLDGKKICEYTCNEYFMKPYPYKYGGKRFVLFKKDLYGYTILNLETLEEYNYFPSDVLYPDNKNFGEAFIITDAIIFKDILIFEGCYWGGPYEYWLLSLKDYKTYPLSIEKKIYNIKNDGLIIDGSSVTILAESQDKKDLTLNFSYEELNTYLKLSKTYDI